ncbi:hypothetical protein KUCAC02_000720 [Chaenocephalus aceratus]|uniref:Uncharacterized protein n=1 Tax=Chaenocephalus aceratus TaxID=36190 RepID=A0ACB9W879_CHAAC|nr:hypothetical protein KUCAC02_000720 [Chaenocephalus aceratus]
MALIGYCTCETLLSFIGWLGVGGGHLNRGRHSKGTGC